MSDQEFVYNKDPYKKQLEARIIGISTELGIKLDAVSYTHLTLPTTLSV